ncbi:MAG: ATP-dependent helicase HrpB [Kofleriaceae bacterium]|nr:ATP-dependent helicase HrpB [Kofleriaceae bacterium]
MRKELPIDEHLDSIWAAVRDHGGAVVVAQPGAGKTTRVPAMLLDACDVPIVCTQPRRIAARLSAKRVAEERSETLGDRIGYEVRFDRKVGRNTRLRFVTEGLALRQWRRSEGTQRILVLDEFHERHLDADMLLAMAAKERSEGGKLAIVVMSATLDPAPISEFLGGVPIIVSEGRNYPIEYEYMVPRDKEPLEVSVSRALRHVLSAPDSQGDILVFLPGVAEIRRCQRKLSGLASERDLDVIPLHGGLKSSEQERSLRVSPKRKVILSTNVAETSITIPGVTCVIDCGTARIARHSPWTGLSSLQVSSISQASAKQRAGRAGRTAKGRCVRLYSDKDLHRRSEFDTPEISRSELSACALQLAASETSMQELSWLQEAPAQAQKSAVDLLNRLGAFESGTITTMGEKMSRLPVHPRLARLIIEAEKLGVPYSGATAAALLGERALRINQQRGLPASAQSESGVLDDIDVLDELRRGAFRPHVARAAGVDLQIAQLVDKSARQLVKNLTVTKDNRELQGKDKDDAIMRALLAGFPDRVGRRTAPRSKSVLQCQGGAVTLAQSSAVLGAEYLLALDVESRGKSGDQRTLVRVASAIDPSWLFESTDLREVDEHIFDKNNGRVVRVTGIYYGDIAVDEERIVDPKRMDEASAREVLRAALLDGNLQKVVDSPALEAYKKRIHFSVQSAPDENWPPMEDSDIIEVILNTCERPTRLSDLKSQSIVDALYWSLSADLRQRLDTLAPTHISLPGRKRVVINYENDRPPWIESRMQDFFGASEGPSVGGGKVPLTLHLLAPNRRAVQVTTDLAGFWTRHYPALRKQLMRRYPRHKWPEKP